MVSAPDRLEWNSECTTTVFLTYLKMFLVLKHIFKPCERGDFFLNFKQHTKYIKRLHIKSLAVCFKTWKKKYYMLEQSWWAKYNQISHKWDCPCPVKDKIEPFQAQRNIKVLRFLPKFYHVIISFHRFQNHWKLCNMYLFSFLSFGEKIGLHIFFNSAHI